MPKWRNYIGGHAQDHANRLGQERDEALDLLAEITSCWGKCLPDWSERSSALLSRLRVKETVREKVDAIVGGDKGYFPEAARILADALDELKK